LSPKFPRPACALSLAVLFLTLILAPAAHAQARTDSDPPGPDAIVASFEAALDAHDARRAMELVSDSIMVIGAITATGKPQVQFWIQDQIDHGVIVEVGPLRVNGSRVTWTTRIWRWDWVQDGTGARYVDYEAAVSGSLITVMGMHIRPDAAGLPADLRFVRASSLTNPTATASSGPRLSLELLGVGLLVSSGVLLGLATRQGAPGSPSAQRGRLLQALRRYRPRTA
jgi:hypothetical protein